MRDFNFFSSFIETKKASLSKYVSFGLIAILVFLIVGGFSFINYKKVKALEKEIADAKDYLNSEEVVKKLQEVEDKKQKNSVMEKYLQGLENINVNMDTTNIINSGLMENIASTIPNDLFIKNMSLSPEGLQVQGISKGRIPIAEFEHNLKVLDIFNHVHVNSINKQAEENNNNIFNMICTFRDVSENENN